MRKTRIQFFNTIQQKDLTISQQDSAFLNLTDQLKEIEYSKTLELSTSSIKKITINNYLNPEKKKMMQTIDLLGYSTLGGMLLIGPTMVAINTVFIPVLASFYICGITLVPIAIISETKQLNLQRTWDLSVKN